MARRQPRVCRDCGRCVPRDTGRCADCEARPYLSPADRVPPLSVDPTRPQRLAVYAERAAAGLPLFEEREHE